MVQHFAKMILHIQLKKFKVVFFCFFLNLHTKHFGIKGFFAVSPMENYQD